MAIEKLIGKLPGGFGAAITILFAPPELREVARRAIQEAVEQERQEIEAASLGISIDEYRNIQLQGLDNKLQAAIDELK